MFSSLKGMLFEEDTKNLPVPPQQQVISQPVIVQPQPVVQTGTVNESQVKVFEEAFFNALMSNVDVRTFIEAEKKLSGVIQDPITRYKAAAAMMANPSVALNALELAVKSLDQEIALASTQVANAHRTKREKLEDSIKKNAQTLQLAQDRLAQLTVEVTGLEDTRATLDGERNISQQQEQNDLQSVQSAGLNVKQKISEIISSMKG